MKPQTEAAGKAAQSDPAFPPAVATPSARPATNAFDPQALEKRTWLSPVVEWLLSYPHFLVRVLRRFWRVIKVPFTRTYLVLRYDEVREVLTHDREFPVAWGGNMEDLTNRRNFVLGMEDGPKYRAAYEQLAKAFPLGDVQEHVELPSAEFANKILDGMKAAGKTRFDAVEELVTAVPARLCESYFGLRIPVVPGQSDRTLFAKWTLAISSNVFGPWPDAARGKLAKAAAERFSRTIRDSIAVAKSGNGTGIVLPRLVAMQGQDPRLDDDAIHAHLFGMVMGFIPTNVLAGGNMLETLLRRPDFMSRARAAAEDDDDELLWRCLREALRFRHINPGPWRTCPNGYTFGPGGPSPYRILPESKVFALTQSAMFDPLRIDRPHVFDPYRRDEDYLVFGIGQHWCIGAYIARAQITQTLKPLLKLKRLEAVDNPRVRTRRFNDLFPLHLTVGVEFPP